VNGIFFQERSVDAAQEQIPASEHRSRRCEMDEYKAEISTTSTEYFPDASVFHKLQIFADLWPMVFPNSFSAMTTSGGNPNWRKQSFASQAGGRHGADLGRRIADWETPRSGEGFIEATARARHLRLL
jgi:hypothetical protein